jgi:HAD superfamily hydrolase (TIGR01490 family)
MCRLYTSDEHDKVMPGIENENIVAAFDFDGTIIKGDSFWSLISITHSRLQLLPAAIKASPILLAYALKLKPNGEAKEALFAALYKGWPYEQLAEAGRRFQSQVLPKLVYAEAAAALEKHKQDGHRIVIVSATFSFLLDEWCRQNGYALLCTEIEVKDGEVTGRFATKNCYGEEKTVRLKQWMGGRAYKLYAYGDSNGDKQLLEMADFGFFRAFAK